MLFFVTYVVARTHVALKRRLREQNFLWLGQRGTICKRLVTCVQTKVFHGIPARHADMAKLLTR